MQHGFDVSLETELIEVKVSRPQFDDETEFDSQMPAPDEVVESVSGNL